MQKRTKFQIRSDAAKQRWVRDDIKEGFWRKHIQACKESGLSKRAYCITHNLSQSSFNAWSREVTIRDREKIPSTNAQELLCDSPAKKNPFVPLFILPDKLETTIPNSSPEEKIPEKQHIEILVPGGAVIRVNGNCSSRFIAEIFLSLKA